MKKVGLRVVAFVVAISLASGCTPSNPNSDPSPSTSPTGSAGVTSTPARTTPTESSDSAPLTESTDPDQSLPITPTPIYPTMPADQERTPGNSHIQAGRWAFVVVAGGSAGNSHNSTMAVRVNGAWIGEIGSLAGRTIAYQPGQPSIDMKLATPYFISYSYVVLDGDPYDTPPIELMPGVDGTLLRVSSPLSDMDCPDYWPLIERDFGLELRRCVVAVTVDGGTPRALVLDVPDAEREFWYFDMPSRLGAK